jgi:hypothetical protein
MENRQRQRVVNVIPHVGIEDHRHSAICGYGEQGSGNEPFHEMFSFVTSDDTAVLDSARPPHSAKSTTSGLCLCREVTATSNPK